MTTVLPNDRRYRVLEVLGRGGFGSVYQARFSGPDGFEKLVAIKLLNESATAPEVLERFRDEARILGLLRDRAVIQVDAPVRLGGRWAVVMEYVDGASLSRVLFVHKRIPPRVMIEVVAEVTRALAKAQQLPGPDGRPLRLIHRDLKPGNLQVTATGEVKVLDFGNARADFDQREASTTTAITGTPGYVAPERFEGIEDPRGDVFSMGVVLYKAVTGVLPGEELDPALAEDPDVAPVLAFSEALRAPLAARPDAREAERRAVELVDQLRGPRLRTWAEGNIPSHTRASPDELVGVELSNTVTAHLTPEAAPPPPAGPRRDVLVVVGVLALITLVCSGGLGSLAVAGYWQTQQVVAAAPPSTPPSPAPRPTPPPTAPVEVLAVAPAEPAPVDPVGPTPEPRPSRPSPAPAPLPAPVAPATAAPAVAPAPEPAPTFEVTVSTVPLGQPVWIDGVQRTGNQVKAKLSAGPHTIAVLVDGHPLERTIDVGPHGAKRWVLKDGTWNSYF